jgi:hypothetical protein
LNPVFRNGFIEESELVAANARSLKVVEFDLKEAIAPQIQNSKNSLNGWLNRMVKRGRRGN